MVFRDFTDFMKFVHILSMPDILSINSKYFCSRNLPHNNSYAISRLILVTGFRRWAPVIQHVAS
jgi:hypothetical protein